MKKSILICLVFVLCFSVVVSLASAQDFTEIPPYGALEPMSFEELALSENVDETLTANNDEYLQTFDSFMSMQMALNSGRIIVMYCPEIVAEYAKTMNPDYVYTSGWGIVDGFMMGVLPERAELRDSLNTAIKALWEDGTLEALETQYLDGNFDFKPAEPVEGRETLRVVVTGDYAPIDYISADGTPCGYNAALMQAIGDQLGYNIEFISVEASQRFMALTSGKADVIFLVQVQDSPNEDNSIQSPSGDQSILITDPYLICDDASVALDQEILDWIDAYFASLQ